MFRRRSHFFATAVALFSGALLLGCQLAPTYQGSDAALPVHPYGRGDGGGGADAGPRPPAFTARYGPVESPWADIAAGGSAPVALGPMRGPLQTPSSNMLGPSVVVGGVAVVSSATALVATDLATGSELWRATDDRWLASDLMATDGTSLCGLSQAVVATLSLVCVSLSDGHELFRDAMLTGYDGSADLRVELEFHDGVLYARGFVAGAQTVVAYDLTTHARLFTHPSEKLWRSIVMVGGDLVVPRSTSDCGAGAGCIDALDPRTGATRATHATTGAMAYLTRSGTEAIFVGVGFGTPPTPLAYDPATHTFRDAPEWMGASGHGGLVEVGAGGTLLALQVTTTGRGNLDTIDLATRSVIDTRPTSPQTRYRLHANGLISAVSGPLLLWSTGSPPAAAFHFESWSFDAPGGYRDLP